MSIDKQIKEEIYIVRIRNSKVDVLTKHFIAYLEDNVYNKITLNDVCQKFFIKKSHLSVIFKGQTGKSPMQYYADLKIQEAKKLFREETLSVSEITDKLGFSSIHNFPRAFKTSTGFSPTGYKKSILSL